MDLAPPGFRPRAGILRALAVAQRTTGRSADADRTVGELETVVATKPEAYGRLMGELVAEARGELLDPPVVY